MTNQPLNRFINFLFSFRRNKIIFSRLFMRSKPDLHESRLLASEEDDTLGTPLPQIKSKRKFRDVTEMQRL